MSSIFKVKGGCGEYLELLLLRETEHEPRIKFNPMNA